MAARNSKARKNARRTTAIARTTAHRDEAQHRADIARHQAKVTSDVNLKVDLEAEADYFQGKVQAHNKTIHNTEVKLLGVK